MDTKQSPLELNEMSEDRFLETMRREVAAGRATVSIYPPMTIWEYADGTVVRYLPEGEAGRRGPACILEVKKDPAVAYYGPEGIAFRIDKEGRPFPKSIADCSRKYPKGSYQDQVWLEVLMDAGYHRLRK